MIWAHFPAECALKWTQNVTCFSYILQQNSDFADTGRWCLVVRSTFQTADIVLFTSALMEARYSDLQKEKRKNAHTPPPKEKKSWGCLTRVGVGFKKKTQTSCNEWGMTHDSRCSVFPRKIHVCKNREAHSNHFKMMWFAIGYTFSLYIHTRSTF